MARARGIRTGAVRDLVEKAKAQGWSVIEYDGQGHMRLLPPDGQPGVSVSRTVPDEGRSVKNLRATLRRRGLQL